MEWTECQGDFDISEDEYCRYKLSCRDLVEMMGDRGLSVSRTTILRRALKSQGAAPASITLDGYAASHRAVRELQQQGELLRGKLRLLFGKPS